LIGRWYKTHTILRMLVMRKMKEITTKNKFEKHEQTKYKKLGKILLTL